MTPASILVVDDEPNMCRTLGILLQDEGRRRVRAALSVDQALAALCDEPADVVVCDLSMPGRTGLELLADTRRLYPETRVILMTAFSTVQSAVEAMRLGASEYLTKPFDNDELLAAVDKALDYRPPTKVQRELRALERDRLCDMVGSSPPMQQLFTRLGRVATSDATVLVTGESGTGKELIARALHTLSRRAPRPFVAINCAALPEALLESELFGHERGAFTGAHRTKVGRLEQADQGTLFLDEIGEMSLGVQAKLLRVIETRAFERLGGLQTIAADLRIVAATNRDLARRIAEGSFREDLFYRLNVITLAAPPLRERGDDVLHLARLFVAEKCAELGLPPRPLGASARTALQQHPFPGNVRELQNLIERAVLFSDEPELSAESLGLSPIVAGAARAALLAEVVGDKLEGAWQRLTEVNRAQERALLRRAIDELGPRPNEEIARHLGMSRRVLELRLAEYGITKKR